MIHQNYTYSTATIRQLWLVFMKKTYKSAYEIRLMKKVVLLLL